MGFKIEISNDGSTIIIKKQDEEKIASPKIEKLDISKSLEIFKKMLFARNFEKELVKANNNNYIKCPIYLSIGQESIPSTISSLFKPDLIFAQHRAHSTYLSFGGNPIKLIDELLGKSSGCSEGKGGSPSIQDENIGMVGHHGLIGENVPLAVGAALGAPEKKIICFFGDGAVEEDYVFTSMAFAMTHKLKVLFVCEDNDLSILTKKDERRNWEFANVLKSIGMPSADISDDPNEIAYYINKFKDNLPAFINCRTIRHNWHTGVGVDNPPEYDRLKLFKKEILLTVPNQDVETLEKEIEKGVEKLWVERLQKQ